MLKCEWTEKPQRRYEGRRGREMAGAHEYIPLFELRLSDPTAHSAFQLSAMWAAGRRPVPPGRIHSAGARPLAGPAHPACNAARHAAATGLASAPGHDATGNESTGDAWR